MHTSIIVRLFLPLQEILMYNGTACTKLQTVMGYDRFGKHWPALRIASAQVRAHKAYTRAVTLLKACEWTKETLRLWRLIHCNVSALLEHYDKQEAWRYERSQPCDRHEMRLHGRSPQTAKTSWAVPTDFKTWSIAQDFLVFDRQRTQASMQYF